MAILARPVALITGASSGIGATFARHLAQRGFDLILVARRTDKLEVLARELRVNSQLVTADLATDEGVQTVVDVIRDMERLELLVNNAGFGTLGRFWDADPAGQEAMHRVRVLATVRLTHAALELEGSQSAVKVQALCSGFTITEFHDTLGVDRKGIPDFLWMKADFIVETSLKGLDKGKVIVVPGWIYRTLVTFLRPLSYAIRRHLKRPFKDRRV